MSIHVCKCDRRGRTEYHLRYPGMRENEAQALADHINAGALATQPPSPCTDKELSGAPMEIEQILKAHDSLFPPTMFKADIVKFARLIEAHHGIPGSRQQATPTPPQEPSQPETKRLCPCFPGTCRYEVVNGFTLAGERCKLSKDDEKLSG